MQGQGSRGVPVPQHLPTLVGAGGGPGGSPDAGRDPAADGQRRRRGRGSVRVWCLVFVFGCLGFLVTVIVIILYYFFFNFFFCSRFFFGCGLLRRLYPLPPPALVVLLAVVVLLPVLLLALVLVVKACMCGPAMTCGQGVYVWAGDDLCSRRVCVGPR